MCTIVCDIRLQKPFWFGIAGIFYSGGIPFCLLSCLFSLFFAKFPITWRYIIVEVFHLCCIFPEKFLGSQVARLK